MKSRTRVVVALIMSLLIWGSRPGCATAAESEEGREHFAWTWGVGLSYPLLAAVSGGVNVPILRGPEKRGVEFNELAIQANVDLGVGGGMVSGGLFVPIRKSPGPNDSTGATAIIFKVAGLRTWMVDVGPDRDRTYKGGLIEVFDAAAGMGAKIGVGYFRSAGSTQLPSDDLVYFYIGLGM